MDWEEIRKEYETTNVTMAELANKHGVKPTTLRSRKNREKWVKKDEPTIPGKKSNATQRKDATQRNSVATPKTVEELNISEDLTEQQKLFCLFYLQHFNATKAYQQVYQCDYNTANANGSRLLAKASIKKELDRLKIDQFNELYITSNQIVNELARQAFADINDFIEFGVEDVPYKDEETGEEKIYKRSFVRFRNDVDGTLIQEVKQGKDGVSLKLYDKQKAMFELLKRVNPSLYSDLLLQAKATEADAKAKMAKHSADKLTANANDNALLQALVEATRGVEDD